MLNAIAFQGIFLNGTNINPKVSEVASEGYIILIDALSAWRHFKIL